MARSVVRLGIKCSITDDFTNIAENGLKTVPVQERENKTSIKLKRTDTTWAGKGGAVVKISAFRPQGPQFDPCSAEI